MCLRPSLRRRSGMRFRPLRRRRCRPCFRARGRRCWPRFRRRRRLSRSGFGPCRRRSRSVLRPGYGRGRLRHGPRSRWGGLRGRTLGWSHRLSSWPARRSRGWPGSRRRSNHRASSHRPGCGHRAYRHFNGPGSRLRLNQSSLRIHENRAIDLHGNGVDNRPGNKRRRHRLRLRLLDHCDVPQLFRLDLDVRLSHRPARSKVVVTHRRHTVRLVDIGDIGDVHDVHVSLLHVNHPRLGNVGDVDAVDIFRPARIPRPVGLAGA